MIQKTLTLFLVRHGEAEHNVQHICSSFPEKQAYTLTQKGREQIQKVALLLAEKKPDVMISSPLQRTKETAEIIHHVTGLSFTLDARLRETDFGSFDGQSFGTFLEKYGDPASRVSPDTEDGVEGYIGIRSRVTAFLHDIQEKYAGKKVVVVSHGDTLEQLHGILMRESPGISATGWYPEKGSCTEIVYKFS